MAPEAGEEEEAPKRGKRKARASPSDEKVTKRRANPKSRATSVASSAGPIAEDLSAGGASSTPTAIASAKPKPKPRRVKKGDDEYVPGRG